MSKTSDDKLSWDERVINNRWDREAEKQNKLTGEELEKSKAEFDYTDPNKKITFDGKEMTQKELFALLYRQNKTNTLNAISGALSKMNPKMFQSVADLIKKNKEKEQTETAERLKSLYSTDTSSPFQNDNLMAALNKANSYTPLNYPEEKKLKYITGATPGIYAKHGCKINYINLFK